MTDRTRRSGLQYDHCPDCGAHTWMVRLLSWGLTVLGALAVAVIIPLGLKINDALGDISSSVSVATTRVDTVSRKVEQLESTVIRMLQEGRR